MHPTSILAILFLLALPGCQATRPTASAPGFRQAAATGLASGIYLFDKAPAKRWAIVLPGASGLKVFDDETHYFRAAEHLASQGFTVLVIDYKLAYRQSPDRPSLPTGGKIAWVIEQSLAWARERAIIDADQPGAIVAWSLGAEGLWPLIANPDKSRSLRISAAAAYYPSNDDAKPITTTIPLLILTGEKDDVTPVSEIRKATAALPLLDIHCYPEAHHGFDIESIQPTRKVSLIPLIGPSGTFGYNPSAASDAKNRLDRFLDTHVHTK